MEGLEPVPADGEVQTSSCELCCWGARIMLPAAHQPTLLWLRGGQEVWWGVYPPRRQPWQGYLTVLLHSQINCCRNGPQEKNLIPQGRCSHCLTNAAMEEDGWKEHEEYICMRQETDAVLTVTTENWHEEQPPDMQLSLEMPLGRAGKPATAWMRRDTTSATAKNWAPWMK